MCVLPKQSCQALPKCYHGLMSQSDSPVIDFYPIDFKLDINGAAYEWMGVNLLPFIQAERLFKAMSEVEKGNENLTLDEVERNKRSGDVMIYYFQEQCESKLKKTKLTPKETVQASFKNKD